jgi:signal transduction histidine kinase
MGLGLWPLLPEGCLTTGARGALRHLQIRQSLSANVHIFLTISAPGGNTLPPPVIFDLDSSTVFLCLQAAALLLLVMSSAGLPGFMRRLPANYRITLYSGGVLGIMIFTFLNKVISRGWAHDPLWNWLTLAAFAFFVISLPWGWRKQRLLFEKQAKTRDRSFWPWILLAGIPILAVALFGLRSIQNDLNAAEQRSRDDAEILASSALGRWNSVAEPRFSGFIAAAEKARPGAPVDDGFKKSEVLGNPGRIELSPVPPPEAEPVLEADWFKKLPAEVRGAWNTYETKAASLTSAQALADFWSKAVPGIATPGLRRIADFALLRSKIAANRITNAYEALLMFRENGAGTSAAGVPVAHLVWRELFRLPARPGDATRLSPLFRQDTVLESLMLVPPLLDELERTWAATDPIWKETMVRLRSDWPDQMRRRTLEDRVLRMIARAPPSSGTVLQHAGDSYVLLTREPLTGPPPLFRQRCCVLIPLSLWDEVVAASTTPTNTRSSRYFDVRLRLGELTVPVTVNHAVPSDLKPLAVIPSIDDAKPALVRAEVFLTDRDGFFAEVRRRALISSLLILAAAGAALAGVAQARRSYVRQEDLNEAQANFVSSVSHELRAPLASVRLLAENLERGGDESPERRREYYGLMVRECRRLGTLVQNVLDWSRIERGGQQYEFAPADLAALARETARLMEPQFAERNVRLELQIASDAQAPDSLEAVVDAASIQQALINLLDNALKHSPAGSVVSLSLARHGERLQFTVADQGPGIPVDEHERIFDRFHRLGSELRRETAGIGIGLSIVKHIANAHGGSVRVFSTLGHGATFTLELPKNR